MNSVDKRCGVYQYGYRLASIVSRGLYNFEHIEVSTHEDFIHQYKDQPVVILNYIAAGRKSAPLGWLTQECIDSLRKLGVRVGVIGHLRDVRYHFDFVLSQNPSLSPLSSIYPLPRPLPIFLSGPNREKVMLQPKGRCDLRKVRIGSFGFASYTKGFAEIVDLVCNQFSEAEINLNISSASYSDASGDLRKAVVKSCLDVSRPRGVSLNITEDFLDDDAMLNFLSVNDLNVFNYDACDDGGVSSVIDFAVSSLRPFAVSASRMFSHVDSSHSISKRPLIDIINSAKPNSYYLDLWSEDALCDAFSSAVNSELLLAEARS